jgi:hypothetical protein
MVKKSVLAVCSVALLAAALALPASAQNIQVTKPLSVDGNVLRDTPNNEIPPPTTTIYNNFGTGTNVWAAGGYPILGATSGFGYALYIAQPFTPAANSHATKVEVPVQYGSGGTTGFEISIQGDCSGVPCGTALANGGPEQETTITPFFTCCTTAEAITASFSGGVSLTAGMQYWVVVDTAPAGDTDTEDFWAFAGKNQVPGGVAFCEGVDGANCHDWRDDPVVNEEPALKVTGTIPMLRQNPIRAQ